MLRYYLSLLLCLLAFSTHAETPLINCTYVTQSQASPPKYICNSSPTLNGLTLTDLLSGAIPFSVSGTLTEAIDYLFWDNSNERLSIGNQVGIVSPTNMTSDTLPTPYVASASGENCGAAFNAFIAATGYGWCTSWSNPQYLEIDLGSSINVGSYSVTTLPCSNNIFRTWSIQGSNDNSTWTTVDSESPGTSCGTTYSYTLSQNYTFRYWKMVITANNGDINIGVNNFVLNGNSNISSAKLHVFTTLSTEIGVIIQAAVSQTANLLEFWNSSGSLVAHVSANGTIDSTAGFTYNGTTIAQTVSSPLVLTAGNITCPSCGSGGGVSSFTGDGTILSNSASTGTVTATLASAAAKTVLGNATSSSAAPTYTTAPVVSGISTANIFNATASAASATSGQYQVGGNLALWFDPANTNISLATNGACQPSAGGTGNFCAGFNAGESITSGSNNFYLGAQAGFGGTTAQNIVAIGASAIRNNVGGNYNTGIGSGACQGASGMSGSIDTCIGPLNGGALTSGSDDIFVGYAAGGSVTSGSSDLILCDQCGQTTLTTGSHNILLGTSSAVDTPASSTSNYLNIGNLIAGDVSHGSLILIGPTVGTSTCGGSPTINAGSNDMDGSIVVGTLGTACTITWSNTKNSAPVCAGGAYGIALSTVTLSVPTTTGFTISATGLAGNTVWWHCFQASTTTNPTP